MLLLTFFSSGSLTVSLREVSALRICAAAMLVEVFSKACIMSLLVQYCHLCGIICSESWLLPHFLAQQMALAGSGEAPWAKGEDEGIG